MAARKKVQSKPKVKGQVLNKAQLATFYDVSTTAIDKWIQSGCPHFKKPGGKAEYIFGSADVANWRIQRTKEQGQSSEHVLKLGVAKERKESALAKLAELDLDIKIGKFIAAELVDEAVSKMVSNFRDRALSIPDQLARELKACKTLNEARGLLRDSIEDALTELSNFDPGPIARSDEESGEAGGATAKATRKRVG